MRRARLIWALLVGSIALVFANAIARAAPAMNEAAPTLVATALDGQTFDLAKLRGKVVLVNFWAGLFSALYSSS